MPWEFPQRNAEAAADYRISEDKSSMHRFVIYLGLLVPVVVFPYLPAPAQPPSRPALKGDYIARSSLPNPYAHIPAQCYIETAGGTQNACQFCHTDGLAKRGFGNNVPQGGHSPFLGDLTAEYAFAALQFPFRANGSINPWENTLRPERLRAAVEAEGQDPSNWNPRERIREDNWSPAWDRRPGSPLQWDSGVAGDPFRLFPALNPRDLPAGRDGFVRSSRAEGACFHDGIGWNTGWRAINFVPLGIFTPLMGSVSGIYIRLPDRFLRDADGCYDLVTYAANLDLLAAAISDHLPADAPALYHGGAADTLVQPGLYPLGTEFAHPLHYVDVACDGSPTAPGHFPGTRANRVKEIRYMRKLRRFDPDYGAAVMKEEGAPAYAHRAEGWIDNGAGWLLAGWIENRSGELRAQTPGELVQCVGCHSGHLPPQDTGGYGMFQSGVGVTVDSTWALPRRLPGQAGWGEMDMLGYRAPTQPAGIGTASWDDPLNRSLQRGEFRHFLETVVGISLYGDMPSSVEDFLRSRIQPDRGYSAAWPPLESTSATGYRNSQLLRAALLRELTARGEYLDARGHLAGAFLYPREPEALENARRYQQVVVTQRYHLGKDVFPETPITFRYFRTPAHAFTHQDGRPYEVGNVVVDRPIETDRTRLTWGVGITPTEIRESPDYEPILDFPEPASRE